MVAASGTVQNMQKHSEPSEYLSIGEAARYLSVTATTLRQWEQEGHITPNRTPNGHRRYLRATIEALLKDNTK